MAEPSRTPRRVARSVADGAREAVASGTREIAARAQPRKRRPYAPRVPPEERREQLLDAALTIIGREGYDRVSIDAIAREAGVTRPVVYGVFDDLGALMIALLDRQQQRALTQLYTALPLDAAAAATPGDPVDVAGLVADATPALHRMICDDPVTWRAILSSPAGMPSEVRERVSGDREQVRSLFESMLGGAGGHDAELLSHALLAVLEHFGNLVLDDPEQYDAQRLTRAATDLASIWPPRGPRSA